MIQVPYFYFVQQDPGQVSWFCENLEWSPTKIDCDTSQSSFRLPFGNSGKTAKGFFLYGRTWISAATMDGHSSGWAKSAGLLQQIHVGDILRTRPGVPMVGFDKSFVAHEAIQGMRVTDARHAGLPARESARAKAFEVAARTASIDGMIHTSSYEIYVGSAPAGRKTSSRLVLKDVHGLWRHPVHSRTASSTPSPLVSLASVAADDELAGLVASADLLDMFPEGSIPTCENLETPEIHVGTYDVMRRTFDTCNVLLKTTPPFEEFAYAAMSRVRRMLATYEDMDKPFPDADMALDAAGVLLDEIVAQRFFGHEEWRKDSGIAKFRDSFDLYRSIMSERHASPVADPDPDTDDEHLSSFSM